MLPKVHVIKKMHRQSGVALFTALILLVIMTMLGLTSMSTSTMEEKMAANSQDINRAFQAAESGLEMVFNDNDAFSTRNTVATDGTPNDLYTPTPGTIGTYNADVSYNAFMLQATRPPRDSGWDTNFAYYHFDLSATSATLTGSTSTLHGGAYQIGKKQ